MTIRFISLGEVRSLTGLSKTSIYTVPDFPRPVKIGGAAACAQGGARWVESEVLGWMRSRIEIRNTQPKPICAGLLKGRPSRAEAAEAKRLNLSIRELRSQSSIPGLGNGVLKGNAKKQQSQPNK